MPPDVGLVVDRQPTAEIIWWRNGTSPVPPFAASEIQAYIKKMSNAVVPVREGIINSPSPPTDGASGIVIATGPVSGAAEHAPVMLRGEWLASVRLQLDAMQGDGFVIRTTGERVILAGTNERSTLYAAYRFLEHLGVRFFGPGFPFYDGQAERVPVERSIQVPALEIHEAASFTYRRKYVEEGWSHTLQTMTQLIDWMAKQRLNVLVYPYDYEASGIVTWDSWRDQLIPHLAKRGITLQVGGHGYQSFLPPGRYDSTHPDWFLDPEDSPADSGDQRPVNVFQIGNEEALQTYIGNVIAYLQARPEIGIFEAWPPDDARWPANVVERFGTIANAQAFVTRELSAAVHQAVPGVVVEVLAFIPATDPPDAEFMYDDATIVDIAPFDRSYAESLFASHDPRNRYYDQLLKKWRESGFQGEMGLYEYYRKYSWHSLPVVLPRLIGKEIPYYLAQGASGLGIYSEPADWITYELTHGLVAALSWNARLRADNYVDVYLDERFGAAAGEMGAYLTLVEEAGSLLFDRVRGNYGSVEVVTKVRAHYLRAKDLLTAARAQVDERDASAFVIERLGWNIDFAIADTEVDYYRLQGEPEKLADARQRARGLVDAHGFDGIILQRTALFRRYDPPVTTVETPSIRDRYRDAW